MVRVVIVEDEESISDLMQLMIKQNRPDWVIEGIFQGVVETVEYLQTSKHPDLLFMDIQLNDGICFSIFEKVKIQSMVIFTTAYDQYAIKAFDVNSIDYLLKPIKNERLIKAMEKFENLNKEHNQGAVNYDKISEIIRHGLNSYRTKFLIKSVTSFYTIFTDDITHFYIENGVVFAVTSDKKEHIIEQGLENLEKELDPQLFYRASRSAIVNAHFILKFENYFGGKLNIQLKPPLNKTILVSRLKATEFKNWMGK